MRDPAVSEAAEALLAASEVVDLHVESYIPPRLWGYDLHERHDSHWLGGRFFGHLDFPRALSGGLTAAMWSIATNIGRGAAGRWRALEANVAGLREAIEATEGEMRVVRDAAELRAARAAGAHAAMITVQGGNAYEAAPHGAATLPDVVRVTLLHLTDSAFGATSSPLGWRRGMTAKGRAFVEALNEARIFVDLAHIDRRGFWDAIDVHDRTQPPLVTHTGVSGVRPHWRNIDDHQIRAIADRGGVVGVIFEPRFLRPRGRRNDARLVVAHLEHLVNVGGEGVAALGSDYDGFITPPPDLRDGGVAYRRLTQAMLDQGFSEGLVQKILGLNFLRAFEALRPGGV